MKFNRDLAATVPAQAQRDLGEQVRQVVPPPPPPPDIAPPPSRWMESHPTGIELVKPILWLQGSWHDGKEHVRELRPERARIEHGIVIIDELGVWFPLSAIHHGKKG